MGRLSIAAEYQQGNNSNKTWQVQYGYDRWGNRFQSGSGNSGVNYTSVLGSEIDAATNRFIAGGSTPTTYDDAGNIKIDTKFRSLKYDYDANGRQTAVRLINDTNVQTAVYDCAGQRVQTNVGGVTRTMVYDIFGQQVADYSGASLQRENIYRGGQLLATETPSAPAGLAATPSTSNVSLNWTAAAGANSYRVERKGAGGSYGLLGTTTNTSITDNGAVSGNAYLYRVCAADGAGNCTSDFSSIVLGMAVTFTDAAIVGYSENPATATTIKAAHITELRTAVNAVRSLAGQSPATWTNLTLTPQSSPISADDVRDLRSRLNDALLALGIQTSAYTDNTIVSYAENPSNATTVKAVHIRELRARATTGIGLGGGGTSGGLQYVLSDLQGSTRAVMNNNGVSSTVNARHDYLPFGEEIGSGVGLRTGGTGGQGYGASDTNRRKYGLTERDDTTGLDHTWFRKYENTSGRWTSPDPYLGSMTVANPQSFNRYAYVQNDPANFVDPSGLCLWVQFMDPVTERTWWEAHLCNGGTRDGGGGGGGDGGGGGGGGRKFQHPKPKRGYDQKRLDECIEKAYSQFKQESAAISAYDKKLSNLPSKDDLGASGVGATLSGLIRGGGLLLSGATIGAAASGGALAAVGSFAIGYLGTTIYKTASNTASIQGMLHNAGMRYKNNRQYCISNFGNSSLPNGGAKLLGPIGFN